MANIIKFQRGKFSIDEFMADFDPTGEKQTAAFKEMAEIFGGKDQIFMLAVVTDYIRFCHSFYLEEFPDEDEDCYAGLLQLFVNELREVV